MTISAIIFGFPALTIAALFEAVAAIKVFPDRYNEQAHLKTIVLFLLGNYVFGALYWGFIYPTFISPLRHLPGPKQYISVISRNLLVRNRPAGELFLELDLKYPKDEMLNISAFANQVFITKPHLLKELLVQRSYEFVKTSNVRGFLKHILGEGLIIVEGDQHRFLRKNTMPAFSFRHVKNLYPMMWEKSQDLAEAIKSSLASSDDGSMVIELSSWASKATLDIIGIAGLGRKLDALHNSDDPLAKNYEELLEPSPEKLIFGLLCILWGREFVRWIPIRTNKTFDSIAKALNDICRPMIQSKRDAIQKKGDDHIDILSLLIKSNNFSDTELKDQLLTYLAAGHETTSSAITWTCYLLSKYPQYQQRVRDEVQQASPSDIITGKDIDLAGILDQLPFLNGIIHETLRLYPTVPMTVREALHDTTLGTQAIPRGTLIVLSMWQMNRSPEVWGPDAGEFKPERWITDGRPNANGGASSNYEFLTFLHGPRSCIGQGFAKAEMRCLLSALVQSFEWELAMDEKDVIPRGVITSKAANGMYLKMKPLGSTERQ